MDILFKGLGDFVTSDWQGGSTTQLAIYPQNQQYADRNFVWRLSSATVEIEESDFTALPDYDRVLIVLEGKVKLVHKNIREVCLCQFQQDCFDGNYQTKSYGKIRDFNLMIKKGNSGFAQVIDLSEEAYLPEDRTFTGNIKNNDNIKNADNNIKNNDNNIKNNDNIRNNDIKNNDIMDADSMKSESFYCLNGHCILEVNGETRILESGQLCCFTGKVAEFKSISVKGSGKVIRACVHFV